MGGGTLGEGHAVQSDSQKVPGPLLPVIVAEQNSRMRSSSRNCSKATVIVASTGAAFAAGTSSLRTGVTSNSCGSRDNQINHSAYQYANPRPARPRCATPGNASAPPRPGHRHPLHPAVHLTLQFTHDDLEQSRQGRKT